MTTTLDVARDFANRSAAEREQLGAQLRDRFFELSAARTDDVELRALVDAIDLPAGFADSPLVNVDGLVVAWHPMARHKALRFVDADAIDPALRDRFARPSQEAPHLAAVFADPCELSFRTYENIVALDRLFEAAPVVLELARREKLSQQGNVYSFVAAPSPTTHSALAKLDTLGLYVPPLDKRSRGGERFIFHSALLAEALTTAVKKAMPKSLLGGFSHVNPVFRCNRFEHTDERFHRHLDTPYFDAARQHVSRYTLLLYVTGGSAKPALDVPGHVAIDTIDAFTCVILDQAYVHEGAPYLDGRKVFLRTELIFTDPNISHDGAIARRFSKAVYWTGQSIFEPELARYADAYYNQVAAAHWGALLADTKREPFVHKQYAGVHFIANGYDFWFAKSKHLTLAECAALTLLDYFNCKIGNGAFRSLCTTQVVDGASDASWIPAFLRDQHAAPALATCDATAKHALFPAPERTNGNSSCCPFHRGSFDATRNPDVVALYKRTQSFAKAHIGPAPIVIMGEEVALDPSRFVVANGRIDVLATQSLAPVNFAACWNSGGSPANYIDVDAVLDIVQLLVPPILYREVDGCYHLQFDFFRNSWMVKSTQARVPVPKIRMYDDIDTDPEELEGDDAYPWIAAVDRSLVSTKPKPDERVATLWWVDDTMRDVVTEMYNWREELDELAGDD